MQIIRELSILQTRLEEWRCQSEPIVLVPTMGNLHAGHLALVRAAAERGGRVLATIFVNPAQFVAGEDYDCYPRSEEEDCRQLEALGTDLVFIPDVATIYPAGAEQHTRVTVPVLDGVLCGKFRPGHFAGVATVVTKLLNMVRPHIAVFGEKDYQQLLIIRRLVADLAIPVDIQAVPTVREADGLALSSRNQYLSEEERKRAPLLYRTLLDIATRLRDGNLAYRPLEAEGMSRLLDAGFRSEYIAIRTAATLESPGPQTGELVVLGAAWLGRTRLIDNVSVTCDR